MRLIDADAFAKRAYEVAYPVVHGYNEHERGLTLTGIAQLLDEAPTIKPKTGRWITHDDCIYCSKCRRSRRSRTPFEDLVKQFNYCPNCGARMEVDE